MFADVSKRKARCGGCGSDVVNGTLRVAKPYSSQWGPAHRYERGLRGLASARKEDDVYCSRYYHLQCLPFSWTSNKARGIRTSDLPAEHKQVIEALKAGQSPVIPVPCGSQLSGRSPRDILLGFDVEGQALYDAAVACGLRSSPMQYREEREVEICNIQGNIVGLQHYSGVAHPGELITLVREPNNAYDRNAVAVHNMDNAKVGHLQRGHAVALCAFLDHTHPLWATRVEAVLRPGGGAHIQFTNLSFFNIPEAAASVYEALRVANFPLGGIKTASGGGPEQVMTTIRAVSAEKSQAQFDTMFDELSQADAALKEADLSAILPALSLPLFDFQRRGVQWMLDRELGQGLPSLWEERTEAGKKVYFNTVVNASYQSRPAPVLGGLLCDDMGLGKTIHVLTLIMLNSNGELRKRICSSASGKVTVDADVEDDEKAFKAMRVKELKELLVCNNLSIKGNKADLISRLIANRIHADEEDEETVGEEEEDDDNKPIVSKRRATAVTAKCELSKAPIDPRATLVVCPTSVLSNWEIQSASHIRPGVLSVLCYHGSQRNTDPAFIGQFDLVLTSYAILSSELKATEKKRGRPSGLFSVQWRRVVLDEAHFIRNRSTITHKACLQLQTTYRWALTGTPLFNTVDDVQSLLSFLRVEPVADYSIWRSRIGRPISQGDSVGMSLLRVLFKSFCLRRLKSTVDVAIQPISHEVHTVTMDPFQKELYDLLYKSSRISFDLAARVSDDFVLANYAAVLEAMLRLRQVCCCPSMITPERVQRARDLISFIESRSKSAELTAAEAEKLFNKLKSMLSEDDPQECVICLEDLAVGSVRMIRTCAHCFCEQCLQGLIDSSSACSLRCPLCRGPFTASDITDSATLSAAVHVGGLNPDVDDQGEGDEDDGEESFPMPAKVRSLVNTLATIREQTPDQRVVVFSQFTRFLDVIARHLHDAEFSFDKLVGTMSPAKRAQTISAFQAEIGGPFVLLVSLNAASTGLSFTRASTVILMDPWWNSMVEEQAIDRLHRFGQTRPVHVIRYVVKDSIEQRVLDIQESKKELSTGLFRKPDRNTARESRMHDLRRIFT